MSDRWVIMTSDGELELNASFTAPALYAGGIDTNALGRRDDRRVFQRSGDGLRTPGPLILRGSVWNDARDTRINRAELNSIRDAVAAATTVVRMTPAFEHWYSGVHGGPLPVVTSDGLGGYSVDLEFWPARPDAIPIPAGSSRPLVSRRTPSDTYFAEVFLSSGPQAIGVTGQNRLQDFVGQAWMLLIDRASGVAQLWRDEGGAWVRVLVPGHPLIDSVVPAGSRRHSLAFDQAATPVVAYELGGVVRVTRWDTTAGQYVQNVSFSGVDPIVAFDAVWALAIGGSDVLVFYLSSDRERVIARAQRDLFTIEYELHDYGQPVILDRVTALAYRYQVLTSSADGRALPEVLVSELYPLMPSDMAAGGAAAFGDVQLELLTYYLQGQEGASADVAFGDVAIVGERALLDLPVQLGAGGAGTFGDTAITGERAFYVLPVEPGANGAGTFRDDVDLVTSRVFIGPVEHDAAQGHGRFGGVVNVRQT